MESPVVQVGICVPACSGAAQVPLVALPQTAPRAGGC